MPAEVVVRWRKQLLVDLLRLLLLFDHQPSGMEAGFLLSCELKNRYQNCFQGFVTFYWKLWDGQVALMVRLVMLANRF